MNSQESLEQVLDSSSRNLEDKSKSKTSTRTPSHQCTPRNKDNSGGGNSHLNLSQGNNLNATEQHAIKSTVNKRSSKLSVRS